MAKKQTSPRFLRIANFSAFKEAEIVIPTLTIITGPQASGKSLVCKLLYFFQDIPNEMFRAISAEQKFENFQKALSARFVEWFPATAWGEGQFDIFYQTDDFTISVSRAGMRGRLKNEALVQISEELSEFYIAALASIEKFKEARDGDETIFIRSEFNWRFHRSFYQSINNRFSTSLTSSQTYIPASRAFFTTFGKTMSAFENVQLLDPITKTFGRLYISLIDRMRHGFPIANYRGSTSRSGPRYRNATIAKVFGGKPKLERSEMVVETSDGRIIPLFALSSGQQELLPLWIALDYFDSTIHYASELSGPNILYIEEPEAHLFPEAQAEIVDVLSSLLKGSVAGSQMVLTTHSPYLLAKVNNLLLAGKMGFRKRKARQQKVQEVVPKSRWLLEREVACYGIVNGSVENLIGYDGLVSTDYIDEVSQHVLDEFSALVELE